MGKDGPSPEQSSAGSTQTASVALTRGEIETAMVANGLSREALGDEEWDRQVAIELAMASDATPKVTPSTPAPDDESPSSDVPLGVAFAGAFGGRGVAAPPRHGKTAHQRQEYGEYYARLHPLREMAVWDCEACEDARFVRVPHQHQDTAVLGVARAVFEVIPCPDCNVSDAVPLYLAASRVQEDWLGLTIDDFQSLPGKERAREVVERWIAGLVGAVPTQHMLLLGGNGVGKTMLASIMVLAACRVGHRAVLWNVGHLMRELQERFGPSGDAESGQMLMKVLGGVPVLALDDWGQEMKSASGWSVSELEALLDERYTHGRATIVTTNLSRDDFAQHVEGRVASRLLDFTRVDVGGDDMRGQR